MDRQKRVHVVETPVPRRQMAVELVARRAHCRLSHGRLKLPGRGAKKSVICEGRLLLRAHTEIA